VAARYITIAGTEYNKTGFGKKWSQIVASYEPGLKVSLDDERFLTDCCSRMDRYARIMFRGKVGFKIVNKSFNGKRVKGVVMITPNSSHEVWVSKGKVVDSLFPRHVRPDPSRTNRNDVIRALRNIIEPQIKQYRVRVRSAKVIKSSVTGKPIFGPYHVDHVYPFIRLVEEWCRENGYDLETLAVRCRGASCKLVSAEVAESWFDYHMLNAKLQVLDASENISKGSKYYG
jgi:hypothetical protein